MKDKKLVWNYQRYYKPITTVTSFKTRYGKVSINTDGYVEFLPKEV